MFSHRVCISVGGKHNFLKDLKLHVNPFFLSDRSINIKEKLKNKSSIKKNITKNMEIPTCISAVWKLIILMDLKLSINSYFCRPDRVILSRLRKKIKENIEKLKFFFFVAGFEYRPDVSACSERTWNYLSIRIFFGPIGEY